jgi:2-oxoglutarate ferredoxin oxidoreductase subunit alpha
MAEIAGVFVQAESELAAINMVFGAAAAGARAMTSSSSPGMSLKQEGISYIAGAELPCVIVNMQRGGPGLGNIAPAQGDYFQSVKGGGHGDYKSIVLAPSSVQELFDFTYTAFNLADKYRNPAIILGDGLLGQMMEPVQISTTHDTQRTTHDGHETVPKPWALTGCKDRAPNIVRSFFIGEGVLEEHNKKLQRKYGLIREKETRHASHNLKDSEIVLVAYGSVARIAKAAAEMAREKGIKTGLIRPITLWPFPSKIISETAVKTKKFLVVEMSAGQMVEDVALAVNGKAEVSFYGRMGGGVPSKEEILAKLEALL